MKRLVLLSVAATLMAAPAFAARVTNLDEVAHTVTFSHAGTVREEVVEPDATVYFPRLDGMVSLKGGKPASSTLNSSSGLLNGIVGAARTADIPAGPSDDFVIWKGGELRLQRRVKGMMGGN
jgi:hypothetical protein